MLDQLSAVSDTALLTLFCRAMISARNRQLLYDPLAESFVEQLIEPLSHSLRPMARRLTRWKIDRQLAIYISMRAVRCDQYARDFIAAHPDAQIVNIACGLDTRHVRVPRPPDVDFYDLDLPPMIALRRTLVDETDRYHMLATSALEVAWMDGLDPSRPTLLIAEGLFMYLPIEHVRALVLAVYDRLPGSQLVCEVFNRRWLQPPLDKLVNMSLRQKLSFGDGAEFRSGLSDSAQMESWAEGMRLLGDWSFVDAPPPGLRALRAMRHFGWLRQMQWIVHYQLGS